MKFLIFGASTDFQMTLALSRLEAKMGPVTQSKYKDTNVDAFITTNMNLSYLVRNAKLKEGQTWERVHLDSESVVHVIK